MPYLTVDQDKKESMHAGIPVRENGVFDNIEFWWSGQNRINIPSGSIKKLIGHELTWEDDPVELIDYESLSRDFAVRVCNETGCDITQLFNHYKHGNEAKARQLIIAFRRVVLKLSLAVSAKEFDRNHATALHCIRTVQSDYKTNSEYRELFGDIIKDYPELLTYKIGAHLVP